MNEIEIFLIKRSTFRKDVNYAVRNYYFRTLIPNQKIRR